jgi:hypothetical protein
MAGNLQAWASNVITSPQTGKIAADIHRLPGRAKANASKDFTDLRTVKNTPAPTQIQVMTLSLAKKLIHKESIGEIIFASYSFRFLVC